MVVSLALVPPYSITKLISYSLPVLTRSPARPPARCLATAKAEKRHVELDRMERRLVALHAIRPAQSEEVDRLEAELAELYRAYLHK